MRLTTVSSVVAGRRRREARCARCGYGIVTVALPERCPMCGRAQWAPQRPLLLAEASHGPL